MLDVSKQIQVRKRPARRSEADRLSALKVKSAKPSEDGRPIYLRDGPGLFLRVGPEPRDESGNARASTTGKRVGGTGKSWVFRFMLFRRAREMGLGPWPAVSLEAARRKAARCRELLAEHRDPMEDPELCASKRREVQQQQLTAVELAERSKAPTFAALAEKYIRVTERKFTNDKSPAQWRATLETYANPLIGSLPIDAITLRDVLSVLEQSKADATPPIETLWRDRHDTATKLLQRIRRVFGYAIGQGLRADNPAESARQYMSDHYGKADTSRRRPAMDWRDLPAFVKALRQKTSLAARCLEFTLLTAARSKEARGAKWQEFDLNAKTWTVPMARMKSRRHNHVVPLSDAAVSILKKMRSANAKSDYVFGSDQSSSGLLSDNTLNKLLKSMHEEGSVQKVKDELTGEMVLPVVHGFRATFSTWAREHKFAREHVESALAHVVAENKQEEAYLRTPFFAQRVPLMQAWADHCESKGGE